MVENGIHYYEDGHFWMEVAGIPETDEEEDDLPPTIIVKKNTKVSFDTGPIKVYSTHSVNEYDRRNEDVDPVAASAEYELEKRVEKMEVYDRYWHNLIYKTQRTLIMTEKMFLGVPS